MTTSTLALFEAFHAYLDPLLEKHAAGEVLIFDDLLSSLKAAQPVALTDPLAAKRISELHLSQKKAYEDAAAKALGSFASEQSLPPIHPSGESEQSYVQRCVKVMTPALPNWKVSESIVADSCWSVVKTRASAAYQQQKQTNKTDELKEEETVGEEEGEDDPDDDQDREEEDEEEDGEVDEESEQSKPSQSVVKPGTKRTGKKQQSGTRSTKAVPAKKKQTTKSRLNNNKRSLRGGRRGGGRGGTGRA